MFIVAGERSVRGLLQCAEWWWWVGVVLMLAEFDFTPELQLHRLDLHLIKLITSRRSPSACDSDT